MCYPAVYDSWVKCEQHFFTKHQLAELPTKFRTHFTQITFCVALVDGQPQKTERKKPQKAKPFAIQFLICHSSGEMRGKPLVKLFVGLSFTPTLLTGRPPGHVLATIQFETRNSTAQPHLPSMTHSFICRAAPSMRNTILCPLVPYTFVLQQLTQGGEQHE